MMATIRGRPSFCRIKQIFVVPWFEFSSRVYVILNVFFFFQNWGCTLHHFSTDIVMCASVIVVLSKVPTSVSSPFWLSAERCLFSNTSALASKCFQTLLCATNAPVHWSTVLKAPHFKKFCTDLVPNSGLLITLRHSHTAGCTMSSIHIVYPYGRFMWFSD